MTDAPGVHQLDKYPAARLMHAVGHPAPALYLLIAEQAGLARITQAIRGRRSALCDEQSRAGTLPVIVGHQLIGHIAGVPAALQRRHNDAVV
jgi:hypothetical protein